MKLSKEKILDILHENREEIRRLGVKRLRLFGSYSTDRQKKDSDVDLLVEFVPNRGLFSDLSDLRNLLEEKFEREVDLVKPHLIRKELRPYIMEGNQIEARI